MPFAVEDDLGGGRVRVDSINEDDWRLVSPLTFTGNQGDEFTVPAGYVTDYASVPRILVWYIAKSGRWTRAAILHDYLLTDLVQSGRLSSVDADGLFRLALKELDVPPVKRRLMWVGVRWGAVGDPFRRLGWWSTAHQVVPISLIALPVFVVPVVAVTLALLVLGALEAAATGGRKHGTIST
jgi:hypothetical protein